MNEVGSHRNQQCGGAKLGTIEEMLEVEASLGKSTSSVVIAIRRDTSTKIVTL